MALTINGAIQENQFNSLHKVSDTYKRNDIAKKVAPVENKVSEINKDIAIPANELKTYLSPTEISVLNEVFGTKMQLPEKSLYSSGNSAKLSIGSKIDIRL